MTGLLINLIRFRKIFKHVQSATTFSAILFWMSNTRMWHFEYLEWFDYFYVLLFLSGWNNTLTIMWYPSVATLNLCLWTYDLRHLRPRSNWGGTRCDRASCDVFCFVRSFCVLFKMQFIPLWTSSTDIILLHNLNPPLVALIAQVWTGSKSLRKVVVPFLAVPWDCP